MTEKEPAKASPFMRFLAITIVAMVALGAAGYYLGWTKGHASVQQATLRVSVQNPSTSDLSVQILVNGKVRDTLVVPRGQIGQIDEQVTFAVSDGAYFTVEGWATPGLHATSRTLVSDPGIYPVTLNFF